MKTLGFSMVWERGLGVPSHESTKSKWKAKMFQCLLCATDFCDPVPNPNNQENKIVVTRFYWENKTTQRFSILLGQASGLTKRNIFSV